MWTLQDAKNRFSAVVEAALRGEPQAVSRRGQPAVVVVAAEDFARLTRAAAARPGVLDHLRAMPEAPKGADDWLTGDRAEVRPRDLPL